MKTKICPFCASKMKRNGRTKAGRQRWRCTACNGSCTHSYDSEAKAFKAFIDWILSKDRQIDMPGEGRTFRRHTSKFWELWPMPEVVDEIHRVVYVDGIYLARNVTILIAASDEYVLSWYLARGETSRAWKALLGNIAPPDMVVTDGGSGFAGAVKEVWPNTRVQRCLFHAFSQVRRYTTSQPRLKAGIELYAIAQELMHIETLRQADWWVERFMHWCGFWEDFLSERSYNHGRLEYTHERLLKARRSLVVLINKGTLFTYLEPRLMTEGKMPATTNRIEGGVNAQLRSVLRNHRGMSMVRRIKAVYWWCYMHTECPKPPSEIVRSMPTDDDIDLLYETYATNPKEVLGPSEWGNGLAWEEFHHQTRYPNAID
ncbi:MAG: IS1249 family transposase [Eggerthellaceae bacterium]|nr:IS1249 family transposase [Eggerthellaceae bacterium]